jgi:hypothetical protein
VFYQELAKNIDHSMKGVQDRFTYPFMKKLVAELYVLPDSHPIKKTEFVQSLLNNLPFDMIALGDNPELLEENIGQGILAAVRQADLVSIGGNLDGNDILGTAGDNQDILADGNQDMFPDWSNDDEVWKRHQCGPGKSITEPFLIFIQ